VTSFKRSRSSPVSRPNDCFPRDLNPPAPAGAAQPSPAATPSGTQAAVANGATFTVGDCGCGTFAGHLSWHGSRSLIPGSLPVIPPSLEIRGTLTNVCLVGSRSVWLSRGGQPPFKIANLAGGGYSVTFTGSRPGPLRTCARLESQTAARRGHPVRAAKDLLAGLPGAAHRPGGLESWFHAPSRLGRVGIGPVRPPGAGHRCRSGRSLTAIGQPPIGVKHWNNQPLKSH
jgi:hypothetical protein